MIIRERAYPRAGLVGNPSDGYFGKTIALTFMNFYAEVTLYESPELEIQPSTRDHSRFTNVGHLVDDVRLFGYYGGIRLLKAAVKRFHDHCAAHAIELPARNFTIRYLCNIPHLVGLAGSSAIITACLRALRSFYGVSIPPPEEANMVLAVETEELGIKAGLQDRVAQVYQGLVFMDFDRELMETQGHGRYEPMDVASLPPLYIAYRAELSEGSEVFHSDLRARFEQGEADVLEAVAFWADLTVRVKQRLAQNEGHRIGPLLDENFDRRSRVYDVGEGNRRMVMAARAAGASAKFTGSGGAIIGTYEDEEMFGDLVRRLEPLNVKVIRPEYAPAVVENGDD